MKKKIIGGIAALLLVTAMVLNVNFNSKSNNMSDMLLANVEALAQTDANPDGSCYRIKSFHRCDDYSFAITECENYYNPVCGSKCALTQCH